MPKSASWAVHMCTSRFVHTEARPHRCSQHHLALKSGVYRGRVNGAFIVSVSRQTTASLVWMLPRDSFPGSGLDCGKGRGRNNVGESLKRSAQTESPPLLKVRSNSHPRTA